MTTKESCHHNLIRHQNWWNSSHSEEAYVAWSGNTETKYEKKTERKWSELTANMHRVLLTSFSDTQSLEYAVLDKKHYTLKFTTKSEHFQTSFTAREQKMWRTLRLFWVFKQTWYPFTTMLPYCSNILFLSELWVTEAASVKRSRLTGCLLWPFTD